MFEPEKRECSMFTIQLSRSYSLYVARGASVPHEVVIDGKYYSIEEKHEVKYIGRPVDDPTP